MKKIIAAVVAALIMVCFSCANVFAAGLNSSEQSVLGNMNTPANMNGNSVYVPAYYLNQAEAFFNTIDMTSEQAAEINGYISAGRSFLEGTGKSSMKELSASEVKTIMSYASSAAGVLDLTAAAGSDATQVKIMNGNGDVVVDDSGDIIKTTGADVSKTDYSVSVVVCAVFAAMLLACSAYAISRRKSLQYEEVKH